MPEASEYLKTIFRQKFKTYIFAGIFKYYE
jgi:hypothetical protein